MKFSEWMGFSIVGHKKEILALMRKMINSWNQTRAMDHMSSSKCERELKRLECTINYESQSNGKGNSRVRGDSLLILQ